MIVLLVDNNLLWVSKLQSQLKGLHHEVVRMDGSRNVPAADIAIVNLSGDPTVLKPMIEQLRVRGTIVIGHAGHREKELLELGHQMGADRLCTNSEIAHNLARILDQMERAVEGPAE